MYLITFTTPSIHYCSLSSLIAFANYSSLYFHEFSFSFPLYPLFFFFFLCMSACVCELMSLIRAAKSGKGEGLFTRTWALYKLLHH